MNPRRRIHCLAALALAFLVVMPLDTTAQTSIDGQHDIAALLAQAQTSFDVAHEDAVLLFDGQRQYWLPDRRLVTFIHRIIRVNTDLAIDAYGDHRIPYDAERCSLQIVTVRTWRDGQWWETGPSGKVETLPFAVREAYDYTNMREMMLLHNGVEASCVLEVAYIIEDKIPFRGGAEGVWSFARPEPAVESWFALGVPPGSSPRYFASSGVPEATRESDSQYGVDVYSWKMTTVTPLRHPQVANAIQSIHHITWSTWPDWNTFGNHLDSVFRSAMQPDDPSGGKIDSLLRGAATPLERAERVARFVNEKTRYVNYSENYWWFAPRSAARTYATAYGHRLDRAILAATLFKRAELQARPAFLSKGYGSIETQVPTLAQFGGVGVWVTGDNYNAWYDPEHGTISKGLARAFGRTVWIPGVDASPSVYKTADSVSMLNVRFDLLLDTAQKALKGSGYFSACGGLSPYGQMVGLHDESETFLQSLASGILPGAKVMGFSPLHFDTARVEVGFTVEVPLPEPDSLERLRVVINDPPGGIYQCLPDDVRLFHQRRESPVYLPHPLRQTVAFRVDLSGVKIVYQPTAAAVSNEAGSALVTVGEEDGVLTISREVELSMAGYAPENWPALRALLLADRDERGRTILFKR